jgi:2-keto-4-pentenoate hydratase
MMTSTNFNAGTLAQQLTDAFKGRQQIALPATLTPATRSDAYATQGALAAQLGGNVRAWKVGTAPTAGDVQGSPIPALCVHESPVQASLADYAVCGLELEVAFQFSQSFPARATLYTETEALSALSSMAASIEIVSSRLHGWPDQPPLLKLADLQNHGLLVLGHAVPYRANFPYLQPALSFMFNGESIAVHPAANPAGDPRGLLTPFINQCVARGLPVQAGQWVTTGSYSGIHFVRQAGTAMGVIEGLPEVVLTLA